MVIYKYTVRVPFAFVGESSMEMPKGAEILSVGVQGNDIVVWARVDDEAEHVHRVVRVLGTGWHHLQTPEVSKYIGTVQFVEEGQPLVFHLFDMGEM